jgi:tRNA dimethylallyltransferase
MKNFFIVISGPTGVGKTDFGYELIPRLSFPVEIVNADMGQFYVPLSIGTAKPDYAQHTINHNLFDIISAPEDFTVMHYRTLVIECMQKLWRKGKVPLVIGGSGFYLSSLFFPPHEFQEPSVINKPLEGVSQDLWEKLHLIDPERAATIHPHDKYRIIRALKINEQTGKPSAFYEPLFQPPGICAFYFLSRDRTDITERINRRVSSMIETGWLAEVERLDPSWHEFLLHKKLIGYPEIIQYLGARNEGLLQEDSRRLLIERIARKTRGYAKRQHTFWKMLKKKIELNDPDSHFLKKTEELNLTLSSHDLYIEQLTHELELLYKKMRDK